MSTNLKSKPALGKGLGALLPKTDFTQSEGENTSHPEIFGYIEIADIKVNKNQPRVRFDEQNLEELKDSIKKHGIIQPITVRKIAGGYELISGERRIRASKAAGLTKIPAYIMQIAEDVKMLELALIENIQRVDLNPIEIANGYQRLIEECGYTQEQVSERVGKERSTVTNFIRLLKLPEKVQDLLRENTISVGHARSLLGLNSKEEILTLAQEVIDKNLSVRKIEQLVKDIMSGKFILENGKIVPAQTKEKKELEEKIRIFVQEKEDSLRYKFGTKVKVKPKTEETGTFEFEFYSVEDFERLVDLFLGN